MAVTPAPNSLDNMKDLIARDLEGVELFHKNFKRACTHLLATRAYSYKLQLYYVPVTRFCRFHFDEPATEAATASESTFAEDDASSFLPKIRSHPSA
jgi:hypothetical protein